MLKETRWELKKSTGLRIFASLLGIFIAALCFYWSQTMPQVVEQISLGRPVVWPWALSQYPLFSEMSLRSWEPSYYTTIVAGLLGAFFILQTKTSLLGFFLIAVAFATQQWMFFLDYRLSHPLHFFISVSGTVFLLFPNKAKTLRALTCLFIASQGLLKFNSDWLLGANAEHLIPFNGQIFMTIPAAFIQLIAPLFLFSRSKKVRAIAGLLTAATLIGDQALFQETIMTCYYFALLFFAFVDYQAEKNIDPVYTSYMHPDPHPAWPYLMTLVIVGLQFVVPYAPKHLPERVAYFFTPYKDTAHASCNILRYITDENEQRLMHSSLLTEGATQCDPYIHIHNAFLNCIDKKDGQTHSLYLTSQIRTGPFQKAIKTYVIEQPQFCKSVNKYSLKGDTAWIKTAVAKR